MARIADAFVSAFLVNVRATSGADELALTAEDVDKAEHKLLMALKAALKIQLREGGPA